jgi:hypothetical protein
MPRRGSGATRSAGTLPNCPGTRYYGSTARGEYMTESEATRQGHPTSGRTFVRTIVEHAQLQRQFPPRATPA